MPDMLATADDREIVVHFYVDTVPYRLLLPHGRGAFRLDVAAPDAVSVGRPWVLRWTPYARGRRRGLIIESHERVYGTGPLPATLLEAITSALRFVERGSALLH